MWFPPKATAEKYQELLEFALNEYGDEINDPHFIFQYENATVHRAKSMKTWFEKTDLAVLPWPSRSPDLNRKSLGNFST